MPNVYKVLGQSNPTINTDTTLYTVPAATSAVLSTINVCNQSATPITFRVAVRPAGASIAAQHYLAYDTPLSASDSIALTLGVTLAATDVVTVRANSASVSFAAFGSEVT